MKPGFSPNKSQAHFFTEGAAGEGQVPSCPLIAAVHVSSESAPRLWLPLFKLPEASFFHLPSRMPSPELLHSNWFSEGYWLDLHTQPESISLFSRYSLKSRVEQGSHHAPSSPSTIGHRDDPDNKTKSQSHRQWKGRTAVPSKGKFQRNQVVSGQGKCYADFLQQSQSSA